MNTSTINSHSDAVFDRNQIKSWICRVDDDKARFIGAEFSAARLIGFIEKMRAIGEVSNDEAIQLLSDARNLDNLVALGRSYIKFARYPSAEMRLMILADEKRQQ